MQLLKQYPIFLVILLSKRKLRKNIFSDISFSRKAKQNSHQDDGYPNSAYGMSKIVLTAASIIQQRLFYDKPEKDIVG